MSSPVGERRRVSPWWPLIAIWGGAVLLVVVGFVVTVAALNATIYSASGFAKSYVSAVDRGDVTSALELAGVTPGDGLGDALLRVPSKGGFDDVHTVGDVAIGGGAHAVTLGYTLDGIAIESQFVVTGARSNFGVFSSWTFLQPPTATVSITPQHDPRFTADGTTVTTEQAGVATAFTVLAPSRFSITHDSTFLTAPAVQVVAGSVGATTEAQVETQAKASFVKTVQTQLDDQLTKDCITQKVLFPAGCPFGRQVDDRLLSDPTWTMPQLPVVQIVPSTTPGQWLVPGVEGTAHVTMNAQSLFDGRKYAIDEDVPFTVSYAITIGTDDTIAITAQ
ncbi:hypothetical protein ACPEEZ_14355 [Frigoribacterium sp. 2-23]|uniref:hypothetical protein n=1 Tax=Frigoribacterium sp. 2-23 TaxID=3415006 RepID=UPI003C6F523B